MVVAFTRPLRDPYSGGFRGRIRRFGWVDDKLTSRFFSLPNTFGPNPPGPDQRPPRCYVPIIREGSSYYRVSDAAVPHTFLGTVTLREVRRYLRRSHGLGLAVLIALAYALGSMIIGGMLSFAPFGGGYSFLLLTGNALGLQSWNYPGLLIEAPWGFVELPFFATFSMVVVSAGVGLGMAVAIFLGVQLIRERKAAAGRPTATGTIAGLTPAMIALVTLGACCSTTAAATAGVGLVAQASGSSTSNLLFNNWYLGVFQIAVVYVALIAQELLLRVYGAVFAVHDPAFAAAVPTPRAVDRRAVAVGALRAGLLAAGVTWVLAVLAAWTTTPPGSASGALWFNWVVEHWLIGGIAIFTGLTPRFVNTWFRALVSSPANVVARAALALGAWTLGAWVPPPLAGAGVEGFANELLGALGLSPTLGAVAPAYPWGLALALRWSFQYLLLAGFSGALAVAPLRVLDWLGEGVPLATGLRAAEVSTSSPTAVPANAR